MSGKKCPNSPKQTFHRPSPPPTETFSPKIENLRKKFPLVFCTKHCKKFPLCINKRNAVENLFIKYTRQAKNTSSGPFLFEPFPKNLNLHLKSVCNIFMVEPCGPISIPTQFTCFVIVGGNTFCSHFFLTRKVFAYPQKKRVVFPFFLFKQKKPLLLVPEISSLCFFQRSSNPLKNYKNINVPVSSANFAAMSKAFLLQSSLSQK